MTAPDRDPFATPVKTPALSFKDDPVGTVKTITVTGPAELKQTSDYDTGEPEFWDAKPGETPKPKMAAVVPGVDEHGEPVSVWARMYPKHLFEAIQAAQKAVADGYRLKDGDTLAIKYTGDGKAEGRKNPPKLYAAKITPSTPPPPADAFGDEPPF